MFGSFLSLCATRISSFSPQVILIGCFTYPGAVTLTSSLIAILFGMLMIWLVEEQFGEVWNNSSNEMYFSVACHGCSFSLQVASYVSYTLFCLHKFLLKYHFLFRRTLSNDHSQKVWFSVFMCLQICSASKHAELDNVRRFLVYHFVLYLFWGQCWWHGYEKRLRNIFSFFNTHDQGLPTPVIYLRRSTRFILSNSQLDFEL